MKKTYLSLLAVFVIVQFSYGQLTGTSLNINNSSSIAPVVLSNPGVNTGLEIATDNTGTSVLSYDRTGGAYKGIIFRGSTFSFNPSDVAKFFIDASGNVGIGTINPDQKLTVNGTIHSSEVKVNLNVPGPDYVFNDDYKLVALTVIKDYVAKNHHLPEIPSADQMTKEGLNLGDMNVKLLKKVEELTLYLIKKEEQVSDQDKQLTDQKKQITAQGKKIEDQQQVNQSLQEQINALARKLNK